MAKFAFITHPLDLSSVFQKIKLLNSFSVPPHLLKRLLSFVPPYTEMSLDPVLSISGQSAEGIGIVCPLLPEHFVTVNRQRVLRKIINAAKIGQRFGAKIIGLGGFTSVFGDEGNEVRRYLDVAVTSGNTYTASLALQGLRKAADLMGTRISESRIAVIGATGDIGSVCTRILAGEAKELILAARNEKRLAEFASEIKRTALCKVTIRKYVADAVRDANLILSVASSLTTIIDPRDVKSGAVICDVAYPANVARDIRKLRDDILVFEGGMATWSFYSSIKEHCKLRNFAPDATIHGCLAETMLLALENRCTDYSIGRGQITEGRINEITDIATRHGFSLAPFHYQQFCYSTNEIIKIKQNVK